MLENAAEKYIFSTSFDQDEEEKGPSKLELEYQRGFEEGKVEGHAAGYKEAMDSIEAQTHNVMETVKSELDHVFIHFDSLVESNTRYSIDLIQKICEKLFLNLPSSTLLDRVMKVLDETLPLVVDQRRLLFYVNPSLVDPLTKRLSQNQEYSELARRMEIIGSDLFKGSECKLAWGKGSLDVNPTETWEKISKIIENYKNANPAESSVSIDEIVSTNEKSESTDTAPQENAEANEKTEEDQAVEEIYVAPIVEEPTEEMIDEAEKPETNKIAEEKVEDATPEEATNEFIENTSESSPSEEAFENIEHERNEET